MEMAVRGLGLLCLGYRTVGAVQRGVEVIEDDGDSMTKMVQAVALAVEGKTLLEDWQFYDDKCRLQALRASWVDDGTVEAEDKRLQIDTLRQRVIAATHRHNVGRIWTTRVVEIGRGGAGRSAAEAIGAPEVLAGFGVELGTLYSRPEVVRFLFGQMAYQVELGGTLNPPARDLITRLRGSIEQGLITPPESGTYSLIPPVYHRLFPFSRYRCALLGEPCRFPVRVVDDGVPRYYEYAALVVKMALAPFDLDPTVIDAVAQREIENAMVALSIPLT